MKTKLSHFAIPYVVWMAIFVVAPIIIMVVYAFSDGAGGATLDNFVQMGGYAAVFGAATNTLFAPVFLCVEVFGGAILPQAAVVCIVAYLFNFGHSVYNQRVREDIVWHVVRRIGVQRKELPLRGKLGAFPVLP